MVFKKMRAALVGFLLVAAATVLATETLPFGSPERYAAFDEYIALCSPGRDASTFNRSAELRELLWGAKSGFVDYATRYQLGSRRSASPDFRFRLGLHGGSLNFPFRAYDMNRPWHRRCAFGINLRLQTNGTDACEENAVQDIEPGLRSYAMTLPSDSVERWDALREYIALSPSHNANAALRYSELRSLLWGERSGFVPSYRSGIGLRTGEPVRTNATQIPPMTVYVDHSNYTFTASPVKFDTDFKRSHQQAPRSLGVYYSY